MSFDMQDALELMGEANQRIRTEVTNIASINFFNPQTLVTAVYDGEYEGMDPTQTEEQGKSDSTTLLPGQVQIQVRSNRRPAWVVMPYGMRVDMVEDQLGSTAVERTSNQHYGMYSMPRVGDQVFAIGFDWSDPATGTDRVYFVLGVMGSTQKTRPPPVDKEDFQMVHRSGSSIRLNDTYAGGGGITTTTVPAMGNLTGNLTMIGNRTMMLAGRKYLTHGQLAKYGDTREPFKSLKIQTYTANQTGQVVTDDVYTSLFANTLDDNETFYDPFANEFITQSQKFLSPPSTTDSLIPLSDDTLLLAQQGGGVFRIDDHNSDSNYSRMTMGAASMSIMVGEEYQDLGRAGNSSAVDDTDASGIGGDGNGGDAGDVGTGTGTFEIQHKSGTRITIDDDGVVNIFTRDPNATIHIDTQDDARIYIGDGDHPVVRSEDETQSAKATTAIAGPPGTHLGFLGIPHAHMHNGHTHTELHTQEKTWV